MFDTLAPELAAWSADPPEPDWSEHPVYSAMVSGAQRLAELLELAPAARPTGELARLDARALPAGARLDLLAVLQEQKNWIEAVQAQVLAEIDAADSSTLKLSSEAVSLALKVPVPTAQAKLRTGRTLVRELPRTLRLLARGVISARHAEVITEAAWKLGPDVLNAFEDAVLERAGEQTVSQLRQAVRRAVIALDPATEQQRHLKALADRKVGFQPVDDGMVQLPVLLGAAQGQSIFTRLTAAARLLPAHDARTMDQKRADLLVDAVLSGLPHDALPELQGRRPSIQVVVSADTLLGLDDEPADLAGYGPITAEAARRLAADASGTWRRLLTDPTPGSCSTSPRTATGPPSGCGTSSPPVTGCAAAFRPAVSRVTAVSTSTSPRMAGAGRPADATARWPVSGTTCARSTPAGAIAMSPTGPSPGPTTPATAIAAIPRNGGAERRPARHRNGPLSPKSTPGRIRPSPGCAGTGSVS